MSFIKLFSLALTILVSFKGLAVDLTMVPSSRSVSDAHRLHEERLKLFTDEAVGQPLRKIGQSNFMGPILGRILTGQKLEEVNSLILDPNTGPVGEVGTDFPGIFRGVCSRKGDYDFFLTTLIPLTYEGLERGYLSEAAYHKLMTKLLTVTGNNHPTWVTIGHCLSIKETENHILMTESARYLTNQLWNKHYPLDLRFDNEKNGFNVWLLRHLQQFLKKDFEEYNSRPYQGYAMMPIMNLVSYAKDERVKLAATMVLDYLSAKFAIQSSQLRRSPPICRQHEFSRITNLFNGDQMTAFFAQLAGNNDIFQYNNPKGSMSYGAPFAMFAGFGKYRPHDMILDLIIHNDQVLEQRVRHAGVESYYKHPKFLITAGGRYRNFFDAGTKKMDAWAYPTSIMSNTGNEIDRSQLLRFEGASKESKRNNMCQYKNFACGMNLKLPPLPEGCLVEKGEWKFINYDSEQCPLKYGYFAAIRVKPYPRPGLFQHRVANDFGTIEVVDSQNLNFEQFMNSTMNSNQSLLTHKSGNVYHTLDGQLIEFNPGDNSLKTSPISKVNGKDLFPEKFSDWDFLSGNVMKSKGDGKIVITNPKVGMSIILDYRNPLAPKKEVIKLDQSID